MITLSIFLWVQFVYIIIGLLVWLGIIAAIASVFGNSQSPKIGVLGPQNTGKTLFLNALRGIWKKEPEQTTQMENYEYIEYQFSDETTITFTNCKDVPGSESFIRTDYEKILKDSTYILFFCNVKQYIESRDYERDVNARLDYIYQVRKSICKDDKSLPVTIILSYADQVENVKKAVKLVQGKLSTKDYSSMCCNPLYPINMTNEVDVKKLIEKLFKK